MCISFYPNMYAIKMQCLMQGTVEFHAVLCTIPILILNV
jgi:hypothetical protein